MPDVTRLLDAAAAGDRRAAANIVPLVHDGLRRLAAARIAAEVAGHTLDATALVHQSYLRLAGGTSFRSKSHFVRAAAESVRRIPVDHPRTKHAEKRGGGFARVPLPDVPA